jgi:chemotaxis protein MotB
MSGQLSPSWSRPAVAAVPLPPLRPKSRPLLMRRRLEDTIEGARPIIIVKKKAGHGGHHGGAWMVAYADFVTAMMALFIVLWLLNTSKPVREAIAGYFRDPAGTEGKLGTSSSGPGAQVVVADDMGKVKDQIEKAMQKMPNFDELKEHIEIKVTAEGLRIELLESASRTFFDRRTQTKMEKSC